MLTASTLSFFSSRQSQLANRGFSRYAQAHAPGPGPMKDVTDLAFLKTLKDLNSLPDYFITEYFRTVAHHKRCRHTSCAPLMKIPRGAPFTASSWAMSRYLARDALALMEHDCAGVDLNMGPAPMVCRRNAGGACRAP